jgi:5-methylcytosine-specific restriction endonuclease McrA
MNIEKSRARWKRWADKNRPYLRARSKAYRKRDPVATKLRDKLSHLKHREKRLAENRLWMEQNRAKRRAYMLVYCAENKEHRRKTHKAWLKKHPEFKLPYHARRRARKAGSDVGDTRVEPLLKAWRKEPSFICYYCEKRFPNKQLHIDHIVAISKGGKHTVENLCKSCVSCNCSKHDRSLQEFVINGQHLLAI